MEHREFNDKSYQKLLADMYRKPLAYSDVAKDWQANENEWYHAIIAIEDLPIVLTIPDLKIYAWCRCKLVADDGSEDHFHWHGLVHFSKTKRESWRRQATRHGIKFASTKNTFKRIICLDHAVGVLRYVAFADGQRVGRRDSDGLVTHPHTHYARKPIQDEHRHKRGKDGTSVRDEISTQISHHIALSNKLNWHALELHDASTCKCCRGEVGKRQRQVANEKRRAYYKTEAGIATKKAYREKAARKRQLINYLTSIYTPNKAVLCKKTIEQLLKKL